MEGGLTSATDHFVPDEVHSMVVDWPGEEGIIESWVYNIYIYIYNINVQAFLYKKKTNLFFQYLLR